MLKGRHIIEPGNLSVQELEELFTLAERMIREPERYSSACRGKILATLFFEPSTRTRLSFEAAMQRLGGSTLGFADPGATSASKGESLTDTIRVVSCYADVIAMRNPKEGAALLASQVSDIPVINAGDGGHHHPTQTITDLLTIRAVKGKTEGLTIGLCGDLKFGRTVHSLAKAMSRYPRNRFVLISPPELEIPDYIISRVFKPAGVQFTQVRRLEEAIGDLDILYMTRVQKERFFNEQDYVRLKDSYILNAEKMALARKDLCVLHPLPRVNEISVEVDADPRAAYFKQVKYGMYARMALIASLLGCEGNVAPAAPSASAAVASTESSRSASAMGAGSICEASGRSEVGEGEKPARAKIGPFGRGGKKK
jgi:aspartate carbamoyltransferase catalytic subunit